MSFIFIYLFIPFVWYFLLKIAGITLKKINVMTFVLVGIIFYQYLGLPLLYFRLDPLRSDDVTDINLVFDVFIYTSITITLMLLGFVFGRFVLGKCSYIKISLVSTDIKSSIYPLVILSTLSICVLFIYLKQVGFENIALFAAFNLVQESSLSLLRSNMGNSFSGKYHWYYLFMNQILKFCVLTYYSILLLKPSRLNFFLFFISFCSLILSVTMATEKGPIAYLLISLLLVHLIIKKNSFIPIKTILPTALLMITLLVFFYINFMGAQSMTDALLGVLSRTLTGQIQPAYHYLQFFPKYQNFLYGRSFTNPMGIFPFVPYNIAQEVMSWYNPDQNVSGVVGSMPTIFWGELYANFGVLGVLIFPFFVGYFLFWFNNKILIFYPTPILIGLYVWFLMYFLNLNGTSLSSYFFDIYSFFVFLSFLFVTIISSKGKLKFVRNSKP
jgi:oligosaccharide repeat unit polymerase